MEMKPEKGNYVLIVPNDEEGKNFLRLMRKYINRESFKVSVRGRHSHRTQAMKEAGRKINSNYDVHLDVSEKFVVYFYRKDGAVMVKEDEFKDEILISPTVYF